MTTKTISFLTTITYSTEDDSPIGEASMRQNLYDAIENERVNGALTSQEVSAEVLAVTIDSINDNVFSIVLTDSFGQTASLTVFKKNGQVVTSDTSIELRGHTVRADFVGEFTVDGDAWRDIESNSLEGFYLACLDGDADPQDFLDQLHRDAQLDGNPGQVLS